MSWRCAVRVKLVASRSWTRQRWRRHANGERSLRARTCELQAVCYGVTRTLRVCLFVLKRACFKDWLCVVVLCFCGVTRTFRVYIFVLKRTCFKDWLCMVVLCIVVLPGF